ncbi:MAG: lipid biosynthesis acyltransferase [Flavipsychrobacter sp.]|nr:lipid biosynthesis acyltransferase [Flavipsychrobacter sp.]
MKALVYYLLLPLIYLISLLPFPVLYLFSDFVYFIVYYVTGYRKNVVMQNMRNAFPDKTQKELNRLCKDFFHYLCDLMLETLKTLTISKKEIINHCKFDPKSFALFEQLAKENKSVILVIGHFGNWEWSGHPCSLLLQHQMYVLYHPVANKYFDRLMYHIRTRTGTRLIPMKTAYKEILAHRDELTITAFIADQTPQPNGAYWTTFLNQDTPVYKGTEVISKKLNYPVVYASIKRVKRGYYEMFAEILVADPSKTVEGEISELHTCRLEQDILSQPETWLWSHRRWKHKRPTV